MQDLSYSEKYINLTVAAGRCGIDRSDNSIYVAVHGGSLRIA